jgi:4-hydroxy-tetrahydrodipicolinate reductase
MRKVCVAGATGWAGSELARGIAVADDLSLVAGVSRSHAGKLLGEVLNDRRLTGRLYASASEALAEPCDVFVEYTKPASAKRCRSLWVSIGDWTEYANFSLPGGLPRLPPS